MKKNPYILRCYIKPTEHGLVGTCIDLDISVQADSVEELKNEMDNAIQSYFNSIDENNFFDLFPRRSPLKIFIEYYCIKFIVRIISICKDFHGKLTVFNTLAYPNGGFHVATV